MRCARYRQILGDLLRRSRRVIGCSLGGSVTGWDRQSKNIGEGAGITVGDGSGQAGDLRGQHLFARHHRVQSGEPTTVVAHGDPLDDEAIDQLPGEPHPYTYPRECRGALFLSDGIVEEPVEVGQGDIDGNAGNRQFTGELRGTAWTGLLGPGRTTTRLGWRQVGQAQLALVGGHVRSSTRPD